MRLYKHDNTGDDYNRSRVLRNNASPYEKKLRVVLREEAAQRKLKFRRQQTIHPFVADFACMKARLLVELDGMSHDSRQVYDKIREKKLAQMGFFIMRFSNKDVMKNVEGVVMEIINQAEKLIRERDGNSKRSSPLPNPPREGEGTRLHFQSGM